MNFEINSNIAKHSSPIPDPLGFAISYVDSSDPKNKVKDIAQIKTNKAKDIAYSQLKQIFMTFISFYFIGSGMSIITILVVGMYGYNSLNAIFNVNNGMTLNINSFSFQTLRK